MGQRWVTVNPANSQQLENGQDKGHKGHAIEIQKIQQVLAARRHIEQAQWIASDRHKYYDNPLFSAREVVLQAGDDAGGHAHVTSDAQREQHQEEQDWEDLEIGTMSRLAELECAQAHITLPTCGARWNLATASG